SCVAVDGRAIAFLGQPGAGKSTTAAAFGALGYRVLSDDVVPFEERGGEFVAYPGYPRIRLWPDALTSLSLLGQDIPPLPDDWGERRYHLDISDSQKSAAFHTTPLALAAVYVLGERSAEERAPFVEELGGTEALMALVSNTFAGRVFDRRQRTHELD